MKNWILNIILLYLLAAGYIALRILLWLGVRLNGEDDGKEAWHGITPLTPQASDSQKIQAR